jgi:hypothetical protein
MAAAGRVFERGMVCIARDARPKLAKFRDHYNHQRRHSSLDDRIPEAFAELHGQKAGTLLGRARQSLLIESLSCAKTALTKDQRNMTAQNL